MNYPKMQQESNAYDIEFFSKFSLKLSLGNEETKSASFFSGIVPLLIVGLEKYINKRTLLELDVAALFEIMACCKMVICDKIGRVVFIETSRSIELIAHFLQFHFRIFTLQVL